MFKIFIFLLVVSSCYTDLVYDSSHQMFQKYQQFIKQYNRTYGSQEEMSKRFEIFVKNYNNTLNSGAKNCSGVTKFSDMDPQEFKNKYLRLNASDLADLNKTAKWIDRKNKTEKRFLQADQTPVPDSFDWVSKGATNEVQNQGVCGGCWAFSALANIEGAYFIKYGYLPKFSEQQLIDCDPTNSGCDGGVIGNAFDYVSSAGIMSEVNYPYIESVGYCQHNPYSANNIVSTWTSAGSEDEEDIKEMLFRTGPLAVTINGDLLQYYTGGVLNVSLYECPYQPTHGVNLVGYGTDEYGVDYWTIRNTWGPDWGENGYFRLARGVGLCGINMYVASAILV